MSSETSRPVVIGIDESENSLHAVTAAAHQAELQGLPLRIVNAFLEPGYGLLSVSGEPQARVRLESLLGAAVAAARTAAPGVAVTTEVVDGTDVAVLLAETERAGLLVVGHRGLGTVTGVLTGAVGLHLLARAQCPMLIVRGPGNPAGPVMVGLEVGSPATGDVLDFAFRQARLAARPLVVVHAGHLPGYSFAGESSTYGAVLVQAAEGEAVLGEVEAVRGRYPDVKATTDMRYGSPAATMVGAVAEASFLVLGSPGVSGFRGLALRSVAMAATQHAPCPVFIVPSHRAARVPVH
jgi:nucleotide-binding universal stress UspA family protein